MQPRRHLLHVALVVQRQHPVQHRAPRRLADGVALTRSSVLPPPAHIGALRVGLGATRLPPALLDAVPVAGDGRQRLLARHPVAHQPAAHHRPGAPDAAPAVDVDCNI